MGIFDKMNILHIFMFLLFVIGVLLIITTFMAYSKLDNGCTSIKLRTKLRFAIGIGTACFTLSIGYLLCVTRCKCSFGKRSNAKIYAMLVTLIGMGSGLLFLSTGIKSDLNVPGCKVDLGYLPDILTGLSISIIVLPVLLIAKLIYSGRSKTKSKNDDKVSYEYMARVAQTKRSATNARRLARYIKTIEQKSHELDVIRDRLEIYQEENRKPKSKDLVDQDRLVIEIAEAQQGLTKVGSTSSASSIGSSGSVGSVGSAGSASSIGSVGSVGSASSSGSGGFAAYVAAEQERAKKASMFG